MSSRRNTVRSPVYRRPNNDLYKAIDDIKKTLAESSIVERRTVNNNIKKKTKPKTNKVVKTKPKTGKLDGFVSRTVAQLQMTLSNPLVAMLLAVIIFSVYTHHNNYDASIIKSVVENLNTTESTKPLASWINTNASKFFAIAATVAASMSLPNDVMYSSMIVGVVVILMMPTAPMTLYFIIIAFVLLYIQLKAKSDKFIVLMFAIFVTIYYNFTTVVKTEKPIVKHN